MGYLSAVENLFFADLSRAVHILYRVRHFLYQGTIRSVVLKIHYLGVYVKRCRFRALVRVGKRQYFRVFDVRVSTRLLFAAKSQREFAALERDRQFAAGYVAIIRPFFALRYELFVLLTCA